MGINVYHVFTGHHDVIHKLDPDEYEGFLGNIAVDPRPNQR